MLKTARSAISSIHEPTALHELRVSQEKQLQDEREMVIDALERSGWVKAKPRGCRDDPRQIAYRIQIMNIEMKQI
ncbi:hypothetical protein P4S72_16835 [Vibrio sp. PP-XX7]